MTVIDTRGVRSFRSFLFSDHFNGKNIKACQSKDPAFFRLFRKQTALKQIEVLSFKGGAKNKEE